jgi:hypothetical protein
MRHLGHLNYHFGVTLVRMTTSDYLSFTCRKQRGRLSSEICFSIGAFQQWLGGIDVKSVTSQRLPKLNDRTRTVFRVENVGSECSSSYRVVGGCEHASDGAEPSRSQCRGSPWTALRPRSWRIDGLSQPRVRTRFFLKRYTHLQRRLSFRNSKMQPG